MDVMQMMSSITPMSTAAAKTVASALTKSSSTTATQPKAMDTSSTTSTTSSTADSSDATSTITSSDFLTLLVSELKNQDPTQPTDPNAYITQLVGVNSLQQLMSINQGITTLDSSVSSTTPSASSS